jgi:hypothetical protein
MLTLIHYWTNRPLTLFFQLKRLAEMAGPNLDGFQLNMCWPPISALENLFGTGMGRPYLVLRVGSKALDVVNRDRKKLADRIGDYLPMASAVIIDPSGGRGEPFNSEEMIGYLDEINNRAWPLRLVAAGGLGPGSFSHLAPVLRRFPWVSSDVEGKVRTPEPEDALDMVVVERYIEEHFDLLRSTPTR